MTGPYSPWPGPGTPWYGHPPQNTIFVPVQMPPDFPKKGRRGKMKHIDGRFKELLGEFEALTELKKKIEGEKKDGKKDEPKPLDVAKFFMWWGVITFFGPPVLFGYYVFMSHLFAK